MSTGDFDNLAQTVADTGTATFPMDSITGAHTSASPTIGIDPGVASDMAVAYKKVAEWKAEKSPVRRKERMKHVRVIRSPNGHRVKLVGANLVELAPIFIRWADRLDRDIRVVSTGGEAAYEFYGRPMVTGLVGANGLCLFLTGSMTNEIREDGVKWRVGLDEVLALKAPPALDTAETPAYANVYDEKKVFIGRADGKLIYTMLYIPQREAPAPKPDPSVIEVKKNSGEYVPAPDLIVPFVEHVLSRYEQMVKTHGAELRGELTEVALREFCSDSQRKRERTIMSTIESTTVELRDLERKVTAKAKAIREAQKELVLLRSGALDDELRSQAGRIKRLVDQGLYSQFKIRHGFLVGMTSPIQIVHEGRTFDLGRFMVSVDRSGQVTIEHETKDHPFHPHIKDGSICFGTIREDIPKLVGMERYAMAFQVLYEFLSSYNPNDKYNKIEVCTGDEVQVRPENVTAGLAQAAPCEGGWVGQNGVPTVSPEDFNAVRRQAERDIQNVFAMPQDTTNTGSETTR